MDVKDLTLIAVFSSLYAVLVIFLFSVSFGPIQLRVADCLLPLAAIFGWPVITASVIGCFIGNLVGGVMSFGSFDPRDVIFGPIANLAATYVIFILRRRRILACAAGAVIVGVIVGGYLWLIAPLEIGIAMPPWAATMISVTLRSLITIGIIGYTLLSFLSRPNVKAFLKSRGLKVFD